LIITQVERLVARFWDNGSIYVRRTIVFKSGDNMTALPFTEEVSTERNNILQKAIRLYISKDKGKLSIQNAELYMLAGAQTSDASKPCFDDYRVRNIGDVDVGVKRLMGYSVTRGPQQHQWLLVDTERQIEFRHYTSAAPMEAYHDMGEALARSKGGGVSPSAW